MVIGFITRYSYHTYFSPISTSSYHRFGTGVRIIRNGEWRMFVNYETLYFIRGRHTWHATGASTKKMLYNSWSYQITIDENPIPLRRICVLSYLCLLLTKVMFETSFKSFQYNTKGRRLSNYSIKLILCSHYHSRYKGLCQNKKHKFTNIQREVTFAPYITLRPYVRCKSDLPLYIGPIHAFHFDTIPYTFNDNVKFKVKHFY